MSKFTSIQIEKQTRDLMLGAITIKFHHRETYNELILRLLKEDKHNDKK